MKRNLMNVVLGSKHPSEMQGFIWNMVGSIVTAMSTMVLSLFVIRIVGPQEGGIFSVALTFSQMLMYVAYFEMRTFQVTDAKKKYTFGEYHTTKILLCLITTLLCILYVVLRNYHITKMSIVFLVCLWKVIDGYADVYESHFQTYGRLDLAGKSMAYRMVFSLVFFFVALLLSQNMLVALFVINITAIIGVLIFDIGIMKTIGKIEFSFEWNKIRGILFECLPLFLGTFCGVYILSISRMAIDSNMDSVHQAYYQVIFLPVSVVNLFAGFVFKPLLTRMALYYERKEMREFYAIVGKGIAYLFLITGICMAGAFVLGIPVLSWLSGCDLSSYRHNLVVLILAGGINAINYTLYYVLTIMRAMKSVLIDYIVAAAVGSLISSTLVRNFGINGATLSFLIVVVVLLCGLTFSIIKRNNKDKHIKG